MDVFLVHATSKYINKFSAVFLLALRLASGTDMRRLILQPQGAGPRERGLDFILDRYCRTSYVDCSICHSEGEGCTAEGFACVNRGLG